MKKNKIALLPGDGIGPEIIEQAVKCLNAIGKIYEIELEFNYGYIGATAIDKFGIPYPPETDQLCRESDAILFGAIGDPKYDNNPKSKIRPEQGLLKMRKDLGLFANIRPLKIHPSLYDSSPLKREIINNVDLIIVRELTSGIYFGKPSATEENGMEAYDTCRYTSTEIERVAKIALDLAMKRRKKVTLVDKANVLETSRLWRSVVTKIKEDMYSQIDLEYMFVDNAAMQLVSNPSKFDIILTENMFGDILSDISGVLSGSIGTLPSASLGEKHKLFEPIHGSYPEAAGKNIANPVATILSAAMMLRELKYYDAANDLELACYNTIQNGVVTPDLKIDKNSNNNYFTTEDVGNEIEKEIKKQLIINSAN